MPIPFSFHGRRAAAIENETLRVTVLEEGGHIAEVFHKQSGVSPLWVPQWTPIEPSAFDPSTHHEFGSGADGKLLAGIMGHNLCLDIFGGPSEGKPRPASPLMARRRWRAMKLRRIAATADLTMRADLPLAGLRVARQIALAGERCASASASKTFRPRIERLDGPSTSRSPRPSSAREDAVSVERDAVEGVRGSVRVRGLPGARGRVRLAVGAARRRHDGQSHDVHRRALVERVHRTSDGPVGRGCVLRRVHAGVSARVRLCVDAGGFSVDGHLGRKPQPPTAALERPRGDRGMEFGVSPFPESRRQMIDRGRLFDVPTYRWIPRAPA